MDTTIQPFWKNKLFWTGLISAVLIAVQQLAFEETIDWKAIGFAAFIAAGGYVATTLRGQNISMLTMIANVLGVIITDANDMVFDWKQLAFQVAFQIIAWVMPDAKPVGYERADVIRDAKIQGQIVTPNALVDSKIKDAATSAKAQAGGNVEQAVGIVKNG